jgi:hypothetical protein
MCVSTPRRCLGNSACGFPVVSLEPAGHPVDSGAAESGCRARLAAPCEARTLRASLFLQVATGSLVGSAVVRNMVRTPCSLLGRPRARLVGTRALETAWRACQGNGLRRINYEVLGNSIPVLPEGMKSQSGECARRLGSCRRGRGHRARRRVPPSKQGQRMGATARCAIRRECGRFPGKMRSSLRPKCTRSCTTGARSTSSLSIEMRPRRFACGRRRGPAFRPRARARPARDPDRTNQRAGKGSCRER